MLIVNTLYTMNIVSDYVLFWLYLYVLLLGLVDLKELDLERTLVGDGGLDVFSCKFLHKPSRNDVQILLYVKHCLAM